MLARLAEPLTIVAILLVSVVIHENAHGWVALGLGDQTAKLAGRLTLNPIKHLDPVGSLIMPAFLAFTAGMAFGFAKPVPVNPRLLKGHDRGFAIVALAGPASNLVLAILGAFAMRTVFEVGGLPWHVARLWVFVNLGLAAFNLLPIPPLDGSRLLRLFLKPKGLHVLDRVEPYGFLILILLFVMLPDTLGRIVGFIQSALLKVVPL